MATLVQNGNPPNLVEQLLKLWDKYIPSQGWGGCRYNRPLGTKDAMAVDPIPNGSVPNLVRLLPILWDEYIPPQGGGGAKPITGHWGQILKK